jgi:tetratricopeptide (TPR) repeat protein
MEFPENLEGVNDPKAFLAYYFLGLTYKLKGDFVEAKKLFRKMTDPREKKLWGAGSNSEILFYEALANIELGEQSSATDIFNKLIIRGNAMLNTKKHSARYMNSVKLRQAQLKSRANAYFSIGLGYKGLGDGLKANTQLKKTLDIDPTHLGAHNFLIK